MIDDEQVLALAMEVAEGGPQALGWATQPQLVDGRGTPCPHAWSSLVGAPSFGEDQNLYRTCPHCGTVGDAAGWLSQASRSLPLVAATEWAAAQLVALTAAGPVEVQLLPWPTGLGSRDTDRLCVVGLDPAEHAQLVMVDPFRVAFVQGVFASSYCDGSELRTSVLDTRSLGDALELGPVRFEVTAPGQITARVPPRVGFTVAPLAQR